MNLTFVISRADVSFGDYHARIIHFQHDHGMGVIVDPQNISGLYILICKLTRRIHSGWQAAKGFIAKYEGKGYAAYGCDIFSVKSPSLPTVISLRI